MYIFFFKLREDILMMQIQYIFQIYPNWAKWLYSNNNNK